MSEVVVVSPANGPIRFANEIFAGLDAGKVVLPLPFKISPARLAALKVVLEQAESGVAFLTSGSVGASKIVIRSINSVIREAQDVAEAFGLQNHDEVVITSPITHSFGFGVVMASLWAGCKVFAPTHADIRKRVTAVKDYLADVKDVNVMTGVPYFFRLLLRSATRAAQRSYAGGEPLTEDLASQWQSKFGQPLLQEYGLSEVGIVMCGRLGHPPTSVGIPIPRTATEVARDGELIVRRADMPTGYLQGESQETFTPNGVRTGDLVSQKDGLFYVVGRKKSLIRVAGLSVVPSEVEAVIMQCPAVKECVVVGRPHPTKTEVPVAYVAPYLSESELRDLHSRLRSQLDSHKVPFIIHALPELPRTASGKVDRNAL